MERKINIAELLKGSPTGKDGARMYCSLFPCEGRSNTNCRLIELHSKSIVVETDDGAYRATLTEEGCFARGGECQLYPAKTVKDWGCFYVEYILGNFGRKGVERLEENGGLWVGEAAEYDDDISYIDRITQQIKVVSYANYKNGYILETGRKLALDRDKLFNTGDTVLVRMDKSQEWQFCTFSHYSANRASAPYCASGSYWKMCIPYNKTTWELLGTIHDYEQS